MAGTDKRTAKPRAVRRLPEWTREEHVREIRARRSREQTPEERLETLRLSRFISELRQGLPDDVRAG
jgi:hypothetical protein